MRKAETVLGIIRERGQQKLPLEDIYRQLYNPEMYLRAYGRIYPNKGTLTPGTTNETADGMSLAKIEKLTDDIRQERYQWTPVRRIYIPKANGKTRPLGIPTWRDKLLQEVIRSILEAYYEPQFSNFSFGFRPDRGCHTALNEIATYWKGTNWFIEGDITKYFDTLDHEILLTILRENLKDNRFIRLIENLLKAGYLEDWKYYDSLSGTPQGGIVSPILSNIYLDKFDKYVEQTLIPEYTRGTRRKGNAKYVALGAHRRDLRKKGDYEMSEKLLKIQQKLPSVDPNDPNYRRLRYVRYADDFILGFMGTKAEAEEIKHRIKEWLKTNLKLELSEEKTLITNAHSEKARFLGYDIVGQFANDKHDWLHRRIINRVIGLRVPSEVIDKKCARYMKNGKPTHRNALTLNDDFSIISQYQAEYRGMVQYYLLAYNVSALTKLRYVMQNSLLKTLAKKHHTRRNVMRKKYQAIVKTKYGQMKCLKMEVARPDKKPLVAQFGGIPLRRTKDTTIVDLNIRNFMPAQHTELIQRLLADKCEMCGTEEKVEVHHIRKLSDLNKTGRKAVPSWKKVMASRRRKTLAVCINCHDKIHNGTI
jgi:group II intron reverse transcriptase/maturase